VELFAVPNPDPRRFAVFVEGGPAAVDLRLYSCAMVCLARQSVVLRAGWNGVPEALGLGSLSRGLYFVQAKPASGKEGRAVLCKFVILR
jgi:hypothetical protein